MRRLMAALFTSALLATSLPTWGQDHDRRRVLPLHVRAFVEDVEAELGDGEWRVALDLLERFVVSDAWVELLAGEGTPVLASLWELDFLAERLDAFEVQVVVREEQVARLESPFSIANSELSELGEMLVLYGQALREAIDDARRQMSELRGGFEGV